MAAAEPILYNPQLISAAATTFGGRVVPNTVVVNVNGPMPSGAIHVDIPAFQGADRDSYPIQLLQAMGASGLFEQWRVIEAGAVFWSYDGTGGTYDYWPSGLHGSMDSVGPPFGNTALLGDNNRMYHRIGRIGDPHTALPVLSAAAEITYTGDDGWEVRDAGRLVIRYADKDIRISILWKARVESDTSQEVPPLTAERIVAIFAADLDGDAPAHAAALNDPAWLSRVHARYVTDLDSID